MTLKLHCFAESGNAYKAALALELAGLPWEPVFVDFFAGATRTPEFRALNPMGEVPVLETGDQILTQSAVIQDWIMETTGKLGASDAVGRREILRWTIFDNQKLSGLAGPLRFMMNFLPEEKRDPGTVAFMTGRLKAALAVLDARLADRKWVANDSLSCADISCAGYLFYPEPFTFARADYPNINRWLDDIATTPGWRHPYDLLPAPTLGQDIRR